MASGIFCAGKARGIPQILRRRRERRQFRLLISSVVSHGMNFAALFDECPASVMTREYG
jgi:hypothetical protein